MFLDKILKKTIVISEIGTLEFVKVKHLYKFGTKVPGIWLFGYICAKIWDKYYCHIWKKKSQAGKK